jgi:hypothetical protein
MYRPTFPWPRNWFEVSGRLHAPGCFTPQGKSLWYPSDSLRRPQIWPARDLEKKINWPYRDSNSDPSIIQPVVSSSLRYPDTIKTRMEIGTKPLNNLNSFIGNY